MDMGNCEIRDGVHASDNQVRSIGWCKPREARTGIGGSCGRNLLTAFQEEGSHERIGSGDTGRTHAHVLVTRRVGVDKTIVNASRKIGDSSKQRVHDTARTTSTNVLGAERCNMVAVLVAPDCEHVRRVSISGVSTKTCLLGNGLNNAKRNENGGSHGYDVRQPGIDPNEPESPLGVGVLGSIDGKSSLDERSLSQWEIKNVHTSRSNSSSTHDRAGHGRRWDVVKASNYQIK